MRDDLEMVDQRLHGGLHLLLGGQHVLVVAQAIVARAHLLEAPDRLIGDARGLAHLVHADHVAIVGIAVRTHRDLEVVAIVAAVRLGLAQIPSHPRAAQDRPRDAQRHGVAGRERRHALGAREPNRVLAQQGLVLVDVRRHLVDEGAAALEQAFGDVARQAAHPEVGGRHARAAHHVVDRQHLLALAEAVEEDRHRADVERVRAEPHAVGADARQLGEQHADRLGALRRLDPQQLLGRQAQPQVVRHRRQVVHAVGLRDGLGVGLVLGLLLHAGVEVADDRLGTYHRLAIQLEHHPEHAVGRRVLRPHVEGHGLSAHGSEPS